MQVVGSQCQPLMSAPAVLWLLLDSRNPSSCRQRSSERRRCACREQGRGEQCWVWAVRGRGWLGSGHASLHLDPLLPAPCMQRGAAPSRPPEGCAVLRLCPIPGVPNTRAVLGVLRHSRPVSAGQGGCWGAPGLTRCRMGAGSKRGLSLLPAGRSKAERAGALPPTHPAWPRLRARGSPVSWNARLGPPAEQLSREHLCVHQHRSARLQVCVMRAPAPHAQPRGRLQAVWQLHGEASRGCARHPRGRGAGRRAARGLHPSRRCARTVPAAGRPPSRAGARREQQRGAAPRWHPRERSGMEFSVRTRCQHRSPSRS